MVPFCALEPVETTSPQRPRKEPLACTRGATGCCRGLGQGSLRVAMPICFNSNVTAIAKRALERGEMLDGEGSFLVWGKQTPATLSLAQNDLPLGRANGINRNRDVAEGKPLRWDVAFDATDPAVRVRREMERAFGRPPKRRTPCQHLCAGSTPSLRLRPRNPTPSRSPNPNPQGSQREGIGKSGRGQPCSRHVYLSYRTKAAGWRATRIKSRRASSTIGGGPAMKLTVPS